MQPPRPGTPYAPVEPSTLYRIEAGEHVTKEVAFHIVRSPEGEPLTYHARLGHAFDFLSERGERYCLLVADDWAVIVDLDPDGQIVGNVEEILNGEAHRTPA